MMNIQYENLNNFLDNYFDATFVEPNDVLISEDKTTITIVNCLNELEYTIYNSETNMQAAVWMKSKNGTVVFSNLNPKIKYSIRAKQKQMIPMPVVKPEIIISPSIPVKDAQIIMPANEGSFNPINGCGKIVINTFDNHGYAILNNQNKPLSEKQIKQWNVRVTDEKGFLLPKTEDGYYFGCKTNMVFEVPAGGTFRMGGKILDKNITYIDGQLFKTIGIYYNAWFEYIPPYSRFDKGHYRAIVNPACKASIYTMSDTSGRVLATKKLKSDENIIIFTTFTPSYNISLKGNMIALSE